MNKVVAGDIGGTKTRLAVVEVAGTQVRPRHGGAEPSGAGVSASHLLPQREGGSEAAGYPPAYSSRVQTADFAITSDLASVVGSPSRMASSSISNVPAGGRPMGSPVKGTPPDTRPPGGLGAAPLLGNDPFALSKVHIEREADYPSRDFASFEALLADFLAGTQAPAHAAFGIAGPVRGRVVRVTNLPWYIEADALQQRFGFKSCTLLNDLEATAFGLPALNAEDLLTLQPGEAGACGNAAVIAAGTGLGEAGLYWDGRQHHPYATEGGHASFSPQNDLQVDLLRYLQRLYGHVSWERVVSGMGLLDLHDFLRGYRKSVLPQWLDDEMRTGDAAAAISRAALAGSDDICIETLDCFAQLYGAEAGNLALKSMSRGGVYVGGGIAPKILPILQREIFMNAFLNKGRMRHLLEAMPVRVILNDRAALYGPALYAGRAASLD
jgi:glucokinase